MAAIDPGAAVALEPVGATSLFLFKLEFPDGRWDVAERELSEAPVVGDLVAFGDGSHWRVRASQLVWPRPDRLPARTFFVCAPAA